MKKFFCTATALLAAFSLSTAVFASGGVVKSVANEMNVVTFESGSETQAKLQYMADSDPDSFYAGLSTDWDDCAFADVFDDQNAFLYAFEINPSIPSTTAPAIVIYNPFDADGDAAVNPKDVVFYRVSNGTLEDVSSYFTAGKNDSGDTIFTVRTRTPGTYILAEKAVDTASVSKTAVTAEPKEAAAKTDATGLYLPSRR
ncbi:MULTISPECIES: hypothetical protein [Anaerotruncus]|jgi:hypothetical protein|uniref:Prealbumin-like fold domain-containing protein n=1 Tax=Anaerotruncus colihominis TaxID=169435 RepID=A0A845SS12_9FIRM|nr:MULTISPECIES: hypothetical protein [Anaerotruncus]MCI8493085.1 hypothetical protein [Anaerotruncus sp.]MCR2024132.1 hypothetical protein [Anaerotruncus colihominis]NDO39316.1 hypothetical protein [Anaerotruncus colihominis]